MIEPGHEKLSLRCQAVLLGINRNRLAVRAHPARRAHVDNFPQRVDQTKTITQRPVHHI